MRKKNFLFIILLLIILFLYNLFLADIKFDVSGGIYKTTFSSSSISEKYEAYSDFYKKIEINCTITGGILKVKNLSIIIDDLPTLISQEEEIKELNHSTFDFPRSGISNQSIVVFSKTKSEKYILNCIKQGRIIIYWEDFLGKSFSKTYNFKDFINL